MLLVLVLSATATKRPQTLVCLGRRKALVDHRYRKTESTAELTGKPLGTICELVTPPVRAQRQPDDQTGGTPFVNQRTNGGDARTSLARLNCRERVCYANRGVTDRYANEPFAKIQREDGAGFRRVMPEGERGKSGAH
jgi:hypothetical protein